MSLILTSKTHRNKPVEDDPIWLPDAPEVNPIIDGDTVIFDTSELNALISYIRFPIENISGPNLEDISTALEIERRAFSRRISDQKNTQVKLSIREYDRLKAIIEDVKTCSSDSLSLEINNDNLEVVQEMVRAIRGYANEVLQKDLTLNTLEELCDSNGKLRRAIESAQKGHRPRGIHPKSFQRLIKIYDKISSGQPIEYTDSRAFHNATDKEEFRLRLEPDFFKIFDWISSTKAITLRSIQDIFQITDIYCKRSDANRGNPPRCSSAKILKVIKLAKAIRKELGKEPSKFKDEIEAYDTSLTQTIEKYFRAASIEESRKITPKQLNLFA